MYQDQSSQPEILDIKKFEGLFKGNHQFLCMIAFKIVQDHYVAEEIVQEFFVKYWEECSGFLLKRNFTAFAYRSVKNRCIDYLRRQSVFNKNFVVVPFDGFDQQQADHEEVPEKDQRLKRVLELFNELPVERRKVLELHAIHDLSYKEIAEKLGISVNTVKTQLRRGYSKLREQTFFIMLLSHLIYFIFSK
ncbi:RNA polymerase sigma factor [Pedobacter sp. MC2016-24]|uniref:RNA polymerase sigma factor n=1 Tax=Pedobacter sp. MC2016-24 TaxID=2780090 RepID=UPI0018822294|nr:RNA polymerase sigma factor [Pedobacter sp. MC2016-24]MBE9597963.1 RNA polymerase sigma factor [Pedobacter sp. MC2016-24]